MEINIIYIVASTNLNFISLIPLRPTFNSWLFYLFICWCLFTFVYIFTRFIKKNIYKYGHDFLMWQTNIIHFSWFLMLKRQNVHETHFYVTRPKKKLLTKVFHVGLSVYYLCMFDVQGGYPSRNDTYNVRWMLLLIDGVWPQPDQPREREAGGFTSALLCRTFSHDDLYCQWTASQLTPKR